MAESEQYIAVIGDLVASRQLKDRGATQRALETTLAELNDHFSENVVSRFVVTLGDEFQGLLRADSASEKVWWSYMRSMRRVVATRFGFGKGPLTTELQEEALGMDGPCFYAARAAVVQARNESLLFALRVHEREDWSAAVSQSARLVNRIMSDWTDLQWETAALFEQYRNQSVVAEKRAVTRQTVHDSLLSSHGLECLDAVTGLFGLLRVA